MCNFKGFDFAFSVDIKKVALLLQIITTPKASGCQNKTTNISCPDPNSTGAYSAPEIIISCTNDLLL